MQACGALAGPRSNRSSGLHGADSKHSPVTPAREIRHGGLRGSGGLGEPVCRVLTDSFSPIFSLFVLHASFFSSAAPPPLEPIWETRRLIT